MTQTKKITPAPMSSFVCVYRVEYGPGQTDKIEAYLLAHPAELPDFEEAVIQSARGMLAWGDYKTAPELFALMCSISARVRLMRGEDVLGDDESTATNS